MPKGPDPIPVVPGNQAINDIYALALRRLKDVLTGEDYTQASERFAAASIRDIKAHIADLRVSQSKWVDKYIPDAYKIGASQDDAIIRRLLGSDANLTYSQLHREAAVVAAEGALQDFGVVADALDRTYTGYVRRAQIVGSRRAIAREISAGILEGATRSTTSNRLFDILRTNAINGKITVGKVTMSARAYADLLTRTVSRSVRTEGTINRLIENDIDLVIVSNTAAVDFCIQYEDQIFSLSGKSNVYPMLVNRPPLHINCTHTLSAWIAEFADEGEAEDGQEFKESDLNLTSQQMAKKYPIVRDDTRVRTNKTQKAA